MGAAHNTVIKVNGTSTALSNAATTKLTANTVYQITDATKRVLDPNVAVLVEVDADGAGGGGYATAAADTYTVDYLFGKVTFNSDQGVNALVRVTGAYLPMLTVAECTNAEYEVMRETLDKTSFDSGGYRAREGGLISATASVRTLKFQNFDFDPGGGARKLLDDMKAGTPIVFEDTPVSGEQFRAWMVIKGMKLTGNVPGQLATDVELESAAQAGSGETEQATLGWGAQ